MASYLETVLAQGKAKQSYQQFEVAYLAANSAASLQIEPAANYKGIIVYRLSFYHVHPYSMNIKLSQSGIGEHSYTLSYDLPFTDLWLYVTSAEQLNVQVTERTGFDSFFGITLSTIGFQVQTDFDEVKNLLKQSSDRSINPRHSPGVHYEAVS